MNTDFPDNNTVPSSEDITSGITKEQGDGRELKAEYREQKKVSANLRDKLDGARTWDIRVKIIIRIILALAFLIILVGQNYFVFKLIDKSMDSNQLKDIQLILGTVITGTLTETYFVVREIVKWAMQEIDYSIQD